MPHSHRRMRAAPDVPTILLGTLLVLGQASGLSGSSLIDEALGAGVLDEQTALLYEVLSITDPVRVPADYREGTVIKCGTPVVTEAASSRQLGQPLAKALARPVLDREHLSRSGRFRIHYSIEGRGSVDRQDSDANTIPDYVDLAAALLDSAWQLQVGRLGYRPPPADGGLGGGNEYDVYIVDLTGSYGFVYPEDGSGFTTHSYMTLDNDYADPVFATHGLDALRVSVAHEFFHAIHFAYYLGADSHWWREATSTWMEEVMFPEVDDYLNYIPHFLLAPERALDSGTGNDWHGYGASIFVHFLDQRYRRATIRSIWEEIATRRSARLEHFDTAVRRASEVSLGQAFGEFAVWNYFTGDRHRSGFYAEGEKYSQVRTAPMEPFAKAVAHESGRVNHMSSAYLQIKPRLRPGGLELVTERIRTIRGHYRYFVKRLGASMGVAEGGGGGAELVCGWHSR